MTLSISNFCKNIYNTYVVCSNTIEKRISLSCVSKLYGLMEAVTDLALFGKL